METVNLRLESGRTVALEVEPTPTPEGMKPAGRTASKAVDLTLAAFDRGLMAVAEVCDRVQSQLDKGDVKYEEAELEMAITFSGEADVKILRAGAEATLGLKVRWKGKR